MAIDGPTARTVDAGYYANERADVVAKIPPPLGSVLDIGCGAGGVGRALRARGAARLVGVEIEADVAERAREVFDEVHVGDAAALLDGGQIDGPFDTFVLYDVLEHLADPGRVLSSLARVSAPGARVHVSVPNARHFSLIADLVVRGTFGYTDWGHRDSTHLRWFTRRDIEALLEEHGWRPVSRSPAVLGRGVAVDRATFGLLREFLALQWHVLATR
jgi:2-polyprenyl-3-methyl-5-hydroxy-6-metoxy-1,4-benzoquinol methylase